MDSRLAQCLLRQAEESVVVLTHQEVAAELGSVREVVSRLLKKFERQKWVRLHRGRIDNVNHDALREIAEKTFAKRMSCNPSDRGSSSRCCVDRGCRGRGRWRGVTPRHRPSSLSSR